MLTTCRHGKDWEKFADQRCAFDNEMYGTYDYQNLLTNSTFCLVPRGRRLGSFRFLESLQSSCVPVVMADGWVLPFQEVLDWDKALVKFSERDRLAAGVVLRELPDEAIFEMRQQGVFLHQAYFSSLEKVVQTTIQILKSRVDTSLPLSVWNNRKVQSGALALDTEFSENWKSVGKFIL